MKKRKLLYSHKSMILFGLILACSSCQKFEINSKYESLDISIELIKPKQLTKQDILYVSTNSKLDIRWNTSKDFKQGFINLYYSTQKTGCKPESIADGWKSIASNLSNNSQEFSWKLDKVTPDVYYICAMLLHEGQVLSSYVSSWLVNPRSKPEIEFLNQNDKTEINPGNIFRVLWDGKNLDGPTNIDLYVHKSKNNKCQNGTLLTSDLKNKKFYNMATENLEVGEYYICSILDDGGLHPEQEIWSNNKLVIKKPKIPPPFITEVSPSTDIKQSRPSNYTVTWQAHSVNEDSVVSLYYKNSQSNKCSDGTLISSGSKITDSSYQWTNVPAGNYYLCMSINDGDNPAVEKWSKAKITAKAPASFHYNKPASNTILEPNSITQIEWSKTEEAGYNTPISLFYKNSFGGECTVGSTLITVNQLGSSYTLDTSGINSGTYYVCALLNDSINGDLNFWSSHPFVINKPPQLDSLTISSNEIGTSKPIDITWTGSDPDGPNTKVQLFYTTEDGKVASPTTPTGACTGTEITALGGISWNPGTGTASYTYTWNTPESIAGKTVHVCAKIKDDYYSNASNKWSQNAFYVNLKPSSRIWTAPNDFARDLDYKMWLEFYDHDNPESKGNLYLDTSDSGDCSGSVVFTNETQTPVGYREYLINIKDLAIANIASGEYYFCLQISDSLNGTAISRSTKKTLFSRCKWEGNTSDWHNPSNWSQCNGVVPTQFDRVVIPAGTPNQPIVS